MRRFERLVLHGLLLQYAHISISNDGFEDLILHSDPEAVDTQGLLLA